MIIHFYLIQSMENNAKNVDLINFADSKKCDEYRYKHGSIDTNNIFKDFLKTSKDFSKYNHLLVSFDISNENVKRKELLKNKYKDQLLMKIRPVSCITQDLNSNDIIESQYKEIQSTAFKSIDNEKSSAISSKKTKETEFKKRPKNKQENILSFIETGIMSPYPTVKRVVTQ